ncbi:hypothetical protein SAZ11_58810 [Streptomyces sp. FXJ1.4098]|nr:hypothetical protein [Streptomyces sp. FXJ1.4098]
MGQLIGPGVELAVRQGCAVGPQREGVRGTGRLRLEELGERPVRRMGRDTVQLVEDAFLVRGEQRQLGHRPIGVLGHAEEQCAEVSDGAARCGLVEHIGGKEQVAR